jgi:hypothetical protein
MRARPTDSIGGNLAGMAAEFNARLSPDLDLPPPPPPPVPPRAAPVREPMQMREPAAPPPPSPPPPLPAQTDHNLAEMAQRLEAALRRPGSRDDIHPPVTDPLAAAPKLPEPPAREARAEPKLDFTPEPKAEPKPAPAQASSKNPFDSLEEEMASLLGRQKT